MTESRDKPSAAEEGEAGKTATKATEDDKETPAMPVPPPAHELPSHVEARSALLAGCPRHCGAICSAYKDLQTGQFIYVDCAEEERAMLPTTIGSQFEAERALAELRTVSRVASQIFDQIPADQLVRPDKPEPAVLRLSQRRSLSRRIWSSSAPGGARTSPPGSETRSLLCALRSGMLPDSWKWECGLEPDPSS